MTSKDCLDLLMSNQKKVKNGFEFINLKTKERVTIEDCYEIIKNDLEILKILKRNIFITAEYERLKEELENDK